jgi:hypothetical protein
VKSSISLRFVLALLIAVGALAFVANRRLPLVRNSLVYASAAQHVIENDFDPRPVVADSKLSHDKPILYAWCSAPIVRASGSHDGLRVTSFFGSVAFFLALVYFARSFRSLAPDASEPWLVWLAAFGPCVVYQFWSAHPDGWFAALAIVSWSLAQRIVAEPETRAVRRIACLGATIYAAILLKNYGLVLALSCPLYLVSHTRKLRAAFPRVLVASLVAFGVIAALVVLAWTGHHPLSRLEGEGGGVAQWGTGELWTSIKGTWIQLALAILIQFHVALAFAFRRAAWKRELIAPFLCFAGIYVAGLMPFPTTFYNMRYFVPLFPLVALVLVRGAESFAPTARKTLLIAHAIVATLLVVVFNVEPAYRAVSPAIPALEVTWIGPRLSLLDNLRMRLHVEQMDVLANIDRNVPAGAKLYMLDVFYYGDAQQGVFERDGLIRADIHVEYAASRGFHAPEPTYFIWCFRAPPRGLEQLGKVTDLGYALLRVEPRS